jgi:hypothetical protein
VQFPAHYGGLISVAPFTSSNQLVFAVRHAAVLIFSHSRSVAEGDKLAVDDRRFDRDAADRVAERAKAVGDVGVAFTVERGFIRFDVQLGAPAVEFDFVNPFGPGRRDLRQRRGQSVSRKGVCAAPK